MLVIPVISIVVPTYHAGSFIKEAIKKKLDVLSSLNIPYELILVMDGKDELSREKITSFLKLKNFKVVYLKNNHGKGFAVRRGMKVAKGNYIGYMDVDNDIDPIVIRNMYEVIKDNKYSAILPSKTHTLSKINYPFKRKLFSKTYHFIVNRFFNLSCSDTQLGAKLYSKTLVNNVLPLCEINGFAFELEMLMFAKQMNRLEFLEIPVVVNFKTQTTISLKNGLNVLSDTFKLFLRVRKFETSKKETNTSD
jgi:glycosyltransferase involved in cell wall biosynthesis